MKKLSKRALINFIILISIFILSNISAKSLDKLQFSLKGHWITQGENGETIVFITEEGFILINQQKDTLVQITLSDEKNLKIHVEGKVLEMTYELSERLFLIYEQDNEEPKVFFRKGKKDLSSNEIKNRINGEWLVVRALDNRAFRYSKMSDSATYVFEKDTARLYIRGELITEWSFGYGNNCIIKHLPYRTGALYNDTIYTEYVNDKLYMLTGVLSKRNKPCEKKPHFFKIKESVPAVTLHEVMDTSNSKSVIEKLFPSIDNENSLFKFKYSKLLFNKNDSAIIDSVFSSASGKKLLNDFKPVYRLLKGDEFNRNGMEVCLINAQVALSGTEINSVLVKKHLEEDMYEKGYAYFIMVLNKKGKKAFAELTEKNIGKQIAILLKDTFISAPRVLAKVESGSFQLESYRANTGIWKDSWKEFKKEYGL